MTDRPASLHSFSDLRYTLKAYNFYVYTVNEADAIDFTSRVSLLGENLANDPFLLPCIEFIVTVPREQWL